MFTKGTPTQLDKAMNAGSMSKVRGHIVLPLALMRDASSSIEARSTPQQSQVRLISVQGVCGMRGLSMTWYSVPTDC